MQASTSRLFAASSSALRRVAQLGQGEATEVSTMLQRLGTPSSRRVDRSSSSSSSGKSIEDPATYLSSIKPKTDGTYFDLGDFHPMLDVHPGLYSNPSPEVRTVHINDASAPMFPVPSSSQLAEMKALSPGGGGGVDGDEGGDALAGLAADASNSFSIPTLRGLHRYPLVVKRVVNMTSKGKQPSMYALVVVGNGNGLVGFGEGKSENILKANDRAFIQAVKSMDYVQRKDSRTTWADMMSGKWGATVVELRSRPPGFGLRTSPLIHQIAKAAGILDLSAKVRGSRNGMNTVKATIQLLHGGAPPLGLGDLSGTQKLARRFKGVGMRTAQEIGLDLGRKAVELR